ncbi:hypothetical protein [Shimia ponticola]|uniref:hypothetical protein n=1 Tax=Shimia ponticola TaxID=2582893 RepID=UPI0011BE6801|nr:hypothetical protein [Shimia ponticola]
MTGTVVFDPLLPWIAVWALLAIGIGIVIFGAWRHLSGWWLRGLAVLALVGAIANPSLQQEDRDGLSDIVLAIVDETASQTLSDRSQQSASALSDLEAEVTALGAELRVTRLADGEGDTGTALSGAIQQALADAPIARVAGVFLITDGRAHDLGPELNVPAPLHVLLTGQPDDWDRRLSVRNAPAFAILDEEVTLTLRVDDIGAAPDGGLVPLDVSIDGGVPQTFQVRTGEDIEVPLVLPHGGMNVLQFSTPLAEGELTDRNNTAIVQINGVRDRLRVLLVSGEPHPGERTWRNLLKSDASVDLVHFTILRPPEKQDGVPVSELSLISFPTRELFLEKIEDFDLIIFDRYKRRGILPSIYLDNVRQYVEDGGAVLIAAGPDFATADSLARSPLGTIIPATPTARVIEEGFSPQITDVGARHPVTEGLERYAPAEGWGRWFRLIDLAPNGGDVVMSGIDDRPLLVLDRVGQGRLALMASDHAWLWDRGFEGGGPQLELLRRLAHWMMKEPELEEEALSATAEGQTMTIIRRTLGEEVGSVTVTNPDGTTQDVQMEQVSPGRWEAIVEGPEIGLYRLAQGDFDAVIALGPAAPREFVDTIADASALAPLVDARRGGVQPIAAGAPDIRTIREGRPAAGRGWLGITPRAAYVTTDVRINPLIPAWAFLLLASVLIVGAWVREGRR